MKNLKEIIIALALLMCIQGCAGTIIGTAVDVAIEIAKVPFKVGGAIVDVMTDDDESQQNKRLTERKRMREPREQRSK